MILKEFIDQQKSIIAAEPEKALANFEAQLKAAFAKIKEYQDQVGLIEKNYRKKVFDLFTLFDIGKEMNSTLDIDSVMQVVVFTSRAQMKASSVHLFLGEENNEDLILPVSSTAMDSLDKSFISFSRDDALIGFLQRQIAPVLFKDILVHPELADACAKIDSLSIKLIIPMIAKEKIMGFLALGEKKGGEEYSEDNNTFLSTIASFAASAFENARLYAKVNNQLALISGLYEISGIINSSTGLTEVLRMVMETMTTGFQAEICALMLFEEATEKFIIKSSCGLSQKTVDSYSVDAADPLFSSAFEMNEPLLLTDLTDEASPIRNFSPEDKAKIKSMLLIPLKAGNKPVGCLNIYKFSGRRSFDEETKKLFVIISSQIAPAILMSKMLQDRKEMTADPFSPFEKIIANEIKRSQHVDIPFSVITYVLAGLGEAVKDLDEVKTASMNDSISAYIRSKIRENDFIVRLSFNKYAIVLPLTLTDESVDIGTKLEKPDILSNAAVHVEKRFIHYPENGKTISQLVSQL